MKILRTLFFPLVSIAVAVFALFPLFHSGFFTIHDDEQIARLYDLNQAIFSGNIPPRIAPNLGFGYGYPFFNFYPPFAYYVSEIFHLLGIGYINSTKCMIAAGFIFSAYFMYLFSKEIFGKWEGVLSSTAYTFISYHAVDVYVRGALAEFFAFVFLPLIFWALLKLQKERRTKYVVFGAFAVAGLILSHNLIAFMSTPFIALWVIYIYITSKYRKKFLLNSFLLFSIGFGLSSYFFLPSFFEREYTLINILTSELANYTLHFVCIHQLWESPWGYGGSIPGCYDGISFEIGKIQIILSIVAFLLAFIGLKNKKRKKELHIIFLFSAFFILTTFFMVKYAKPLWDLIPPLWYVQFPWRFLIFTSFFSSVLSAGAVFFIKSEKIKGLVVVLLVIFLIGFSFDRFFPQRFFNTTDLEYTSLEKIRWETSSLAYEYVPKEIGIKKSKENTTQVNISKSEIKKSSFEVVRGDMSVQEVTDKPQEKRFTIKAKNKGIFRINTFSFPGWTVYINNQKVNFTDNNKLKLIDVPVMPGDSLIEAKFTDTPIRSAGNVISLLSIILTAGLCIFSWKKNIL